MKYSIIIPVFNRPDEVDELLQSLTTQTEHDFEVIVVEDGSKRPCKEICDKYGDRVTLSSIFSVLNDLARREALFLKKTKMVNAPAPCQTDWTMYLNIILKTTPT